ncbi:MAG: transglutaminase domain-containing protein [Barnesiella sp.]|nr:transglutaminase domain-containing protein [Barnesiella sp.]
MKISTIITFISMAMLSAVGSAWAATDSNVAITHLDNYYKFVPAKDGNTLERIDITSQTSLTARRIAETAIVSDFYDSDKKLKKATGGNVKYGAYSSGDIFFDDSKIVMVEVDLKKPSATGKATITTSYVRPEFFNKVLILDSYDIDNATFTFEVPASMASRFTFEPRNIPADKITTTSDSKSDKTITTITVRDIKHPKTFSDAPSLNITAPQIIVRGHFSDVNDLYRYFYKYIDSPDPAAAAVEAKAKEITAGCTTDDQRIQTITRFVHDNIRYVAVEHGEFGQRPDHPSEVLRKLYGDCKGSATLLKAMFRAVGLDARTVWIGTDQISDNWTDFPAICSGNHMISAVMLPDSILFIDGTARFDNPPHVPLQLHGRQAMIEDTPDRCLTAFVPSTPASDNCLATDFTLNITPDGLIDAKGSMTNTGDWHKRFLYKLNDTPPAKHNETILNLLLNQLKGKTARLTDGTEISETSSTVTAEISNVGKAKKIGNDLYVDLNMMPDISALKYDTRDRTVGGQLSATMMFDSKVTLNIPAQMQAAEAMDPVSVSNPWFDANVTTLISPDGRSAIRTMRLETKAKFIPADKLSTFNSDLNKLAQACSSSIQLTPIN